MRIELHLILWVSALVFGAFVIFHGYDSSLSIGYPQVESGNLPGEQEPISVDEAARQSPALLDSELLVDAPGTRDIFTARTSEPVAMPAEVLVAAPILSEIVLKGVVGSGPYLRIIVSKTGSDAYFALAAGEKFEQFEVKAISDDGAILRNSSTGEERILTLRGLGEAP